MKKIAIIIVYLEILFSFCVMGCTRYHVDDDKNVDTYDNQTANSSDDLVLNDYFMREGEYTYSVIKFFIYFREDVSEITVEVNLLAKHDEGNVYQISIKYKDTPERTHFADDRYNLGIFYVTKDNIVFLMDYNELLLEKDYSSNGMIVCSNTKDEHNPTGFDMRLEYDDDTCECRFWNPLVESGYYCDMVWTKGKGLTYYQSGFGAEKDPIEIELETK